MLSVHLDVELRHPCFRVNKRRRALKAPRGLHGIRTRQQLAVGQFRPPGPRGKPPKKGLKALEKAFKSLEIVGKNLVDSAARSSLHLWAAGHCGPRVRVLCRADRNAWRPRVWSLAQAKSSVTHVKHLNDLKTS